MRNVAGHIGVAVAGVLSFAVTVAIVVLMERFTGFNLFTLSFWLVVPAGALITGAAAASGYYFGSLLFHTRPTWFMLAEVVVVAAVAMLAIYYAEYATYTLDGIRIAEYLGFSEYMQAYLTTMEMTIGRAQTNTGQVGDFGYVLAAIEFVGFIAGGVFIWIMLRQQAVCVKCSRYLRNLVKRTQQFSTQEEFAQAYDNLFAHPVDTPGFGDWLRWSPRPTDQKLAAGVIQTTTNLKGCPYCGDQQVHQSVSVMSNKSDWQEVPNLSRSVRIPEGIDLRPAFRAG